MRTRLSCVAIGIVAACQPPASGAGTSGADNLTERPAAISGELAQCTIAQGPETDPFYRRDTVTCTATIAEALPLHFHMTATVTPANGDARSAQVGATAAGAILVDAQSDKKDAYPLTLTFEAVGASPLPSRSSVQLLADNPSLRQSFTIASPTSPPVAIRLPYDFWPISVHSSEAAGFQIAPNDASISPWTNDAKTTASVATFIGSLAADQPLSFLALAPTGTKAIPVHFDLTAGPGVDAVFDGPGAYSLSPSGLVFGDAAPSPAPTVQTTSFGDAAAETFVACQAGADSPEGQPISCTTRSVDNVDFVADGGFILVDGQGAQASFVPMTAGSTLVGMCKTKPCSLELDIHVRVGVNSTQIDATATLPLDGASAEKPLFVRLPFDVWTIDLDPRGKKVFRVALETQSTAVPSPWTGGELFETTFAPSSATTIAFPVAVGTSAISGTMRTIDKGPPAKIVDAPAFTVTRGGKYQVTDSFAFEQAMR